MAGTRDNFFAINLTTARIRRGLSADELARKVGVDKSMVRRWEKGKNQPRSANLRELCRTLDVTRFDLPPEQFNTQFGFSDLDDHAFIEKLPLYTEEFSKRIITLGREAKLIQYTSICKQISHSGRHRPIELADRELSARIAKGEVIYQRVQVFFDETDVLNAMMDEYRFKGKKYYCKYFPTPPISVPTINISSYDEKTFVVGGYYESRSSTPHEYALLFDHRQPISGFLREYWRVLWTDAIPFPKPHEWQSSNKFQEDLRLSQKDWTRLIKAATGRRAK
jgi:transcriptional regulator with XRE-family HTH domain